MLERREGADLVAYLPHQFRQIHRLENQVGMACIGARQRQHVLDKARRFGGLLVNLLKGLGGVRIQVRVAESVLGYRADKRNGAAQFMRGIGGEAVDLSHRGFQARQHLVTGFGEMRDLVSGLVDREPLRQVADADRPHGGGEPADRAEHAAAEPVSGERRNRQQRRDGSLEAG